MFRALVLIHRYVGIAVGILMAMWCLSGVVMMYVPYPRLTDEQRIAGLPPIAWQGCCHFPEGASAEAAGGSIPDSTSVQSFQLEMLGGGPVLRTVLAGLGRRVIDLRTGSTVDSVSGPEAIQAASALADSLHARGSVRWSEQILQDQWTVGLGRGERPFYALAFDDPARTVVYVSSTSGKVVQVTQSAQRFWNWLGSVPHWLYPTVLRQHVAVWNQVVIWTAAVGTFLTVIGLYLGIRELRRRADGSLSSPHRGWMYWHHVPGLFFGALVLSWVLSGLLSMNPWGLMEPDGAGEDVERLSGELPQWSQVRDFVEAVAARGPAKLSSLASASFGGELSAVASFADGSRVRLDAMGMPKPLGNDEWQAAAARLAPDAKLPSWTILNEGDAYYYGTRTEPAAFPVIRILSGGTVRYYLDPISGRLINKVDAGSRAYRWWHNALHTFDFSAASRSAWFRNGLMLPLLLGAALVCITGTWLGIRRLRRMLAAS